MSFLQLENESDGLYIKHHYQLGKFVVNDEPVDFEYFLLSPDFYTGWGKYDGQYEWKWDQVQGVPDGDKKQLYEDGFKRAFSVQMYIKDKGTYLWQRFSKAEGRAFDQVMSDAWSSKEDGKVVCVKYNGSEKIALQGGSKMYVPNLTFEKWVAKPEGFGEMVEDLSSEEQFEKDFSNPVDKKEDDIPF
jgi:hypothetical protein